MPPAAKAGLAINPTPSTALLAKSVFFTCDPRAIGNGPKDRYHIVSDACFRNVKPLSKRIVGGSADRSQSVSHAPQSVVRPPPTWRGGEVGERAKIVRHRNATAPLIVPPPQPGGGD